MAQGSTAAGMAAIEAEAPWSERALPRTIYEMVAATARRTPHKPALSFQLTSSPNDPGATLSWGGALDLVTRLANLFRLLGVGPGDAVAYILPNAIETAAVLIAGATAGVVSPINPLLEPDHIAALLRKTGAKVVVTLAPLPKSDVAEKVAQAVSQAPAVAHVVEVDLGRYVPAPKRWLLPLVRPRRVTRHQATIHAFAPALADQPGDRLTFAEPPGDRVAAYFHTGGTTGLPKMAQHRHSGVIFNAWLGGTLMYRDDDVLLCPLPLFHVFGAYPVTLAAAFNGAHVVYPTPAGYRGDGVLDNFWKLVERWRASFTIAVPTALAALMQRPIDADISTLRLAICGSAPLPLELYKRFERATGVTLVEGYGLTEATCLVACNPPEGVKKIGSVGLPLPYVHIRILRGKGEATHLCGVDEIGEICIASPGVSPGSVYTEEDKNHGLFAEDRFLRTGDLGRIDADGYLFITGRAKDLIIRGGHNIDPAEIEEALAGHPDVAMVGAVGQPDPFAGEMPCAYVELVAGAQATPEALMEHLRAHISERAAIPKHLEILPALPKTAIGKVFKPELRKLAIRRVYDETLAAAGLKARVAAVIEDERRGLVARLAHEGEDDPAAVSATLGAMTYQWEWARSE